MLSLDEVGYEFADYRFDTLKCLSQSTWPKSLTFFPGFGLGLVAD